MLRHKSLRSLGSGIAAGGAGAGRVRWKARAALLLAAGLSLAALGLPGRAWACSQCMCGTPFPAGVLGGVVPKQVMYGFEDRYLSKTSGLEDGPGEEEENEHRVAGYLMWRPLDRLALLGRLPYNFKRITDRAASEAPTTQAARGVGDAELTVLFGVLRGAGRHEATLGLVLGASAPTGSNELRDTSGERLDIHLQPGTGAWAGTTGINFVMGGAGGTWEASVLERLSGTSRHGYRYGETTLYNAGYTSRAWNGLQLLAEVNGRSAARDRLEDGGLGEHTGGSVIYAAPGLRWLLDSGLGLEGSVQVPVVQRLYGDQREHATARISLSVNR